MDSNKLLLLVFIVLLAVVLASDDISAAAGVLGLLASYFVILNNCRKLCKTREMVDSVTSNSNSGDSDKIADNCSDTDLYGGEYEEHQAYNTSYGTCYDPSYNEILGDTSQFADVNNVRQWQRRTRDKRAMDGWASKGADYYKYHYANELAASESKQWWGEYEY